MNTGTTKKPDDWSAIDAAFDKALDLEGQARTDYLASLPTGLRDAVETLLASATESGPLDSGLDGIAGNLLLEAEGRLDPMVAGRRIGPYRIVERLGAGGMAVVYLAERADGEFEHQVALKIIRWEIAEPGLIDRFMTERRILAQLSHPYIATLLDGGMTPEGLPYLVLERVRGCAIDEYCTRNDLDLAQRVALVEKVGRAVDFAHRQFVVHRDLKPSNILVREDGVPKLVDFGVAKLLEGATADGEVDTHTLIAPLTPRYAAPEQRSGGLASVATDVWGLGVVLYELVAGVHPFEEISPGDPGEPALPSRAAGNPALRGDLDNIIGTTLRSEPERRYRTAGELADDLERWRLGLPVNATPDTWSYRLRKLIGRHRAAAVAVVVAHLVAALGLAGILWQAHEARIGRDRARAEANHAEQVTRFLEVLFERASPRLGEEPTARDLLDAGAQRIRDDLADEPRVQARLLDTLGNSYSNLGDHDRAEELLRAAVELESSLGENRKEYVSALTHLGGVLYWSDQNAEAEVIFRDALQRLRGLGQDQTMLEASLLHSIGMSRGAQGDQDEAIEHYRAALKIYDPDAPGKTGMVRGNLASALTRLGRLEEAEQEHRAALDAFRQHDPTSITIATVLNNLAINLSKQGRIDEAVAVIEQCRSLRKNLPQGHPDLAATDANLAAFMIERGRPEDAVVLARSATMVLEGSPPGAISWIGARANLGWALAQTGKFDEAETWLTAVVNDCKTTFGADHRVTARARTLLGELWRRKGRLDQAEHQLRRAAGVLRSADGPPLRRAHVMLAWGAVLCDMGKASEGFKAVETSNRILDGMPDDWRRAEAEIELARCLKALGRTWDEEAVVTARVKMVETRGADAWVTRRSEALR